MKARGVLIVLPSGTRIAPYGDLASEVFFAGETIAESQARAAKAARLERVTVDGVEGARAAIAAAQGIAILTLDRVYISEKALTDFITASKASPRPTALGLEINASVEYTRPLQDLRVGPGHVVHDVIRAEGAQLPPDDGAGPVAWVHALRNSAHVTIVPKREVVREVPLPVIGERGKNLLRFPITSTVVVSIEHWVHVLWLNQIAPGIRINEIVRKRPLWAIWRIVSAFSLEMDHIVERLVVTGKRVKIHPTAYVAFSVIGDGATIGAHAVVRNSIVGAGTVVQEHAALTNCVVGQDCLITENTFLVSVVSWPEATIGNYKLQVSLIGRGAYVNAWAGLVDAKFVGHVQVPHHGALASTERAFIGSAIGHRAKVAAKVLIQAGREVPNDTVIVMRPDEVVSVVPKDLPEGQPLVRDKGTLVPLGQESRAT